MNTERISALCADYSTPFYLFDIHVLQQRIQTLRARLPKEISLCYAMKANPFLLPFLSDIVDRFEVCSEGELQIFHNLHMPWSKLVVSGVVKNPQAMETVLCQSSDIGAYTVESRSQLMMLDKLGQRHGIRLPVLLRLSSGNQFGLDEKELRTIFCDHARYPGLDLCGIQYFSGTQKTSLRRLQRELQRLDDLISDLNAASKITLRELEFGPGMPVAYFIGEHFDEEAYLHQLSESLKTMNNDLRITLELGRSLAASCGSYVSRIVETKTTAGQNYALLDGGIHQLVYYGHAMAMKQPFCQLIPQRTRTDDQHWNLCGSLCTINDILVKQLPAQNLQAGDLVVFHNAGAYCMTEGMSLFLSHDLPLVLIQTPQGSVLPVRPAAATWPLNLPVLPTK